jgi:hypothetical protein
VTEKLDKAIEGTTQFIEYKEGARQLNGGKHLVDYEKELTEAVEELISEIAKIKTNVV